MKKIISFILTLICLFAIIPTQSFANPSIPVKKKLVALTFDDGPCKEATGKILDILAEYNVKATFFPIGKNIAHNPELFEQIVNGGHEIGNHTYNHPEMRGETLRNLMDEIEKTDDLIYSLAGIHTSLLRPPQGICTESVRTVAKDGNYEIILWDVDTKDWTGNSTQAIVQTVKQQVKSGDIILFHDYVAFGGHTADALEILIPWLLNNDYQIVTVSELL